jgi:tRNA dimethylallyltransferase
MVAEATRLHTEGLSWKRMESLGLEYRFLAQFLQKKITKEKLLLDLEIAIRQYSKRQMIWFKKNKNIQWFAPEDATAILEAVKKFVK